MKILWTDRARRDLLDIGRYIAQDNPRAARAWVEQLQKRTRKAAETPFAGRMVPERSAQDIREVIIRNYRIVYRVCEDAIHMLTVFEGHRLFSQEAVSDTLK
ncbi:MAG: type II toxin-antitoxin system RelE/ParE family toxin [Myxococcales bacterium]|jgi:addiction module RelE/StbE family toxin|nr:type II toxin-antitoxin system RelE/ParE family toxin [Myxococcales bacterium]